MTIKRKQVEAAYEPLSDVAFRGHLRLLASAGEAIAQSLAGNPNRVLQEHAAELIAAVAYTHIVLSTGAPPTESLEREAA